MNELNELELVKSAVAKNEKLILETERYLWNNPQTGYKEWKADAYLKSVFRSLGYDLVEAGNIPGFYTEIDTGRPGPCIAILGEMDALIIEDHPDADPETKAVHACGHHTQCATLTGVAAALKQPHILDGLSGRIRLMAVPAEEIIELEYRESLIEQGAVKYLQGKPEFIYRGFFDGVDMAMLIHAGKQKEGTLLKVRNGPTCACIIKKMTFIGKAAHAGARPEQGINALYAANLALNAVNALRERFLDDEHIRFHPIITSGGDAINVIPGKVVVESYLRGSDIRSLIKYNRMINNAFAGAAASVGARLVVSDWPGSFPMRNDPELRLTVKEAIESLEGEGTCLLSNEIWSPGGTDLGNLSTIMPTVQPSSTGICGVGHSRDFRIVDPRMTCVIPAECLVRTAMLLLTDGAERARRIIENYQPEFTTKEEYFKAMEAFNMHGDVVSYNSDGSIVIDCGV